MDGDAVPGSLSRGDHHGQNATDTCRNHLYGLHHPLIVLTQYDGCLCHAVAHGSLVFTNVQLAHVYTYVARLPAGSTHVCVQTLLRSSACINVWFNRKVKFT